MMINNPRMTVVAGLILGGITLVLHVNGGNNTKNRLATTIEFKAQMNQVAEAWNAGDARKAADCYTEQPPFIDVQVGIFETEIPH